MTVHKAWIERQTKTPEARRLYEEERLIAWATEAICEAMNRSGISKAELAASQGTSRAYVTQLLAGSKNMTLRTLARIAFACGKRVKKPRLEGLREGKYINHPIRVVLPVKRRPITIKQENGSSAVVGPQRADTDFSTAVAYAA